MEINEISQNFSTGIPDSNLFLMVVNLRESNLNRTLQGIQQ
jgi:hypothetical protein